MLKDDIRPDRAEAIKTAGTTIFLTRDS